jgi:hypothetical protein
MKTKIKRSRFIRIEFEFEKRFPIKGRQKKRLKRLVLVECMKGSTIAAAIKKFIFPWNHESFCGLSEDQRMIVLDTIKK